MADVSVRPAGPDDAAEIARIQLDTWRTAYNEILPALVLDNLVVDDAAAAWTSAITERPSARHHVLVAMEGEWRVGFTAFGPADELADDDPEPESTVAVAPLLVEPRWGRRGHGSRLLAATVDHARQDGMTRAIAWVPEKDAASRDFLVSAGWAPDGLVRALDTGAGEVREVRLVTSLAEPGATP
jgi:GNAT superfamily N-acetyltransferase